MRIRKYDFNWGRRELMKKAALGVAGAGLLAPVSKLLAEGKDIGKAYP
ncbi:MAG: twin-arginine translocation signal domain-containing protein, partial [Nevskiaceae bacterium]